MIDYWMRVKNIASERHSSKLVHKLFVDFAEAKAEHWPNAGDVSLLLPWNKELIIIYTTKKLWERPEKFRPEFFRPFLLLLK